MAINFVQTLEDPKLLGQFISDQETILAWKALWSAFFALPPGLGALELYQAHAGRTEWPTAPAREAWIMAGIRSGKSSMTALLACFLAVFKEYKLAVGEVGYVLIVAPTRQQAGIIKRYLSSFFTENAFLKPFLKSENAAGIELTNGISITVLSSDYRSLRGFTAVAAIVDEVAYLSSEGQRPDIEVIRALRGRLMSTGGPLIAISSPYAKTGTLYTTHKKHFGADGSNILVWQASSLVMNPTLNAEAIAQAHEEDPEGARADYDAEFRSDIETFISREAVEACVIPGRFELPPVSSVSYAAFVDPSGGSGADSFTLCIAHAEGDLKVVDVIREVRPPFSPEQTISDLARCLKTYRVRHVVGDRFGGEFPREAFRSHDIDYRLSDKAKSELYKELLPMLNSGRVLLLDHPKMITQLCNLERRTARGGRDSIDHPQRAHDDIINAVAGAVVGSKVRRIAGALWR